MSGALTGTEVFLLDTQVFEYLSTDLKKWMDRNGKGPAHPLPKAVVKVRQASYARSYMQKPQDWSPQTGWIGCVNRVSILTKSD